MMNVRGRPGLVRFDNNLLTPLPRLGWNVHAERAQLSQSFKVMSALTLMTVNHERNRLLKLIFAL